MAYYVHAPIPIVSDVHSASQVPPQCHDPALSEMLAVPTDEAFVDYVVDFVVTVVQCALDKSSGGSSSSQSLKQPAVVDFVRNAFRVSQCPASTVLVALVYLDRAQRQMRISQGSWACERAFLGALMLANKYVNDTHYSYQAWADASGMFSKRAVIHLELELLDVLQFNLSVRSHDITSYYSSLMSRCQSRRVALPPAMPQYNLRPLAQSCDECSASHWSPTGTSSSSSSASPYDSPTLLTPNSHLQDGSGQYQWVSPAYPSGDACKLVWAPLLGARPACPLVPPHDPLFPQSPNQRIFGDAPDLPAHTYARNEACKGFDMHSITLPHLSEVIPSSLVYPQVASHGRFSSYASGYSHYLLPADQKALPAPAPSVTVVAPIPQSFDDLHYAW